MGYTGILGPMEENRPHSGYLKRLEAMESLHEIREDDLGLVRRAQQGDVEAVGELYTRYERKLLNYLYRFTGNREMAEDLVQETFIRAVRYLPAFRPTGSVGGWLYRIAKNLALNHLRRLKRASEVSMDEPRGLEEEEASSLAQTLADPKPGPAQEAGEADLELTVQTALMKISPVYREAMILCDIQGHTYQAAAQILGCPIDTIASRLARGRAQLAQLLGYLKGEIP